MKITIRTVLVIIFFITCFFGIEAHEIVMHELPKNNIIPESKINCFYQDIRGNMWYGSENGLFRNDGYNIEVYRTDFNNPDLLSSNQITCITENKNGDIIFGTVRGAYILHRNDNSIHHINDKSIYRSVIRCITVTNDNSIWIATENDFVRFNESGELIKNYPVIWENLTKQVNTLIEDSYGQLWVLLWKGGILKYDKQKDSFKQYLWPFDSSPTCFLKDEYDGKYWIGTWKDGIIKFDPNPEIIQKDSIFRVPLIIGDKQSRPHKIMTLVKDSVMNYLWIMTSDNLSVFETIDKDVIKKVTTTGLSTPLYRRINNMICDNNGNLWLADKYNNSFIISFSDISSINYSDKLQVDKTGFSFDPNNIHSDCDYIWFRQKHLGLFLFEKNSGQLTHRRDKSLSSVFIPSKDGKGIYCIKNNFELIYLTHNKNSIVETPVCTVPLGRNDRIRTIYESSPGIFWIGSNNNLYRYNSNIDNIRDIFTGNVIINNITSAGMGDIFVSTEQNGVFRINAQSEIKKILDNENCVSLYSDNTDYVWIGTLSGNLFCYNINTDKISCLTSKLGLNGEPILNITSDSDKNIWILTRYNLYIYNEEYNSNRIFTCNRDFKTLEYFTTLSRDNDENIIIAGSGGIYEISALTNFKYRNEQLSLSTLTVNNCNKYDFTDIIYLRPDETNIELYFTNYDLLNSDKTRFSFRVNNDTLLTQLKEGDNHIYLSSLKKGVYDVEVICRGNDTSDNYKSKKINIIKKPYWYETTIALLFYVIILITLVSLIIIKYINYHKTLERMKADIHISEMKSKFLANISHEFRTPLSLISMPLEKMIKESEDEGLKQQLIGVNKNAENLLVLVNELLDFKNIETENEQLNISKVDITYLINEVCSEFVPLALSKNIKIINDTAMNPVFVFADNNKIGKCVANLISNAIKFTPENGEIKVLLNSEITDENRTISIEVEDNGIGIPQNEISKIFERFYRVDNGMNQPGNGIGLHIVKEYIALHNGLLEVSSQKGKGSKFKITIPINDSFSELVKYKVNKDSCVHNDVIKRRERKTILLIEDNREFCDYVKSELSLIYDVCDTDRGENAIEMAKDLDPDIIISDVMLPGISGIEICAMVKNDISISHIPVILMTADCSVETMSNGYKEGADFYITKPFVFDILLSNIRNLLSQRNNRHKNFANQPVISPEKLTISVRDEKFIEKVIALIENNISNSEYTIERMSSDMAMSRMNFFRKMRSLTGMSPVEFVNNMRLKKAATLLLESDMTIVEIGYAVGFNSPSYFTKSFKKVYGVIPSQYKINQV